MDAAMLNDENPMAKLQRWEGIALALYLRLNITSKQLYMTF